MLNLERALVHLNETERDCVARFLGGAAEQLGPNLLQVWLFGSAARGDLWPEWTPFHSDIDLLFLTERAITKELEEYLVNQTYPLFLECGRQISPQFRTLAEFNSPDQEQRREFVDRVRAEGHILFPRQTEPGDVI